MKTLPLTLSLIAALALAPTLGHADPDHSDRLELEMSFWSGLDVTRDGRDVGPGFLNLALADAVRGSANGERHASNASAWAITGTSLGVAALALLAADILISSDVSQGPFGIFGDPSDTSLALGAGYVASLLTSVIAGQLAVSEVFAAVHAYNQDLDRGRLRTASR